MLTPTPAAEDALIEQKCMDLWRLNEYLDNEGVAQSFNKHFGHNIRLILFVSQGLIVKHAIPEHEKPVVLTTGFLFGFNHIEPTHIVIKKLMVEFKGIPFIYGCLKDI